MSLEFITTCGMKGTVITALYKNGERFASMRPSDVIDDRDYGAMLRRLRSIRQFLDMCGIRNSIPIKIRELFNQDENIKWVYLCLSSKKQTVITAIECTEANRLEVQRDVCHSGFIQDLRHYIHYFLFLEIDDAD